MIDQPEARDHEQQDYQRGEKILQGPAAVVLSFQTAQWIGDFFRPPREGYDLGARG
jgi:hypothetical protein